MASEQLERVVDNPHYWQWVIVGLHNALQGFMVLALRGGTNLNVLTDKCAEQWLAAYERGDVNYPEQRLDRFLNLYKKIKSNRISFLAFECGNVIWHAPELETRTRDLIEKARRDVSRIKAKYGG